MPEVSQAVEDRFVDCNTDQVEGLTWDEVQQCEVKMMIKRMMTVKFFRRGTWCY